MIGSWVVLEANQDAGHVIAADTLPCVLGQEQVQYIANNLGQLFLYFQLALQYINQALAIIHVALPNTITAHDNKLVISLISRDFLDVGFTDDKLLVVLETTVLFVVEVSEGPR